MTPLEPSLVERVLDKMGLQAAPTLDLAGLATVYSAWCHRVPFDNARKLIAIRASDPSPLPGDEATEFFDSWLLHGAGGTCWAGNGALCELLNALGFPAARGVATMMVAPDLPPNHGTVVVDLDGERYLVDASILFVEPLRVVADQETSIDHAAWGVRGHWLDHRYAIEWKSLQYANPIDCRVDEWSVDTNRYRTQHEATREWSPFNFELTLTLCRDDGRVGWAQGQAVRETSSGERVLEPVDRVRYLVEELGLSEELATNIPEDEPMPAPPGSRTAAEQESGDV